MYIYLIPIVLACLFSIINPKGIVLNIGRKKHYYNIAGFFMLFLIIFAGFRGDGTGDYFTYLMSGRSIKTFSDIFNNTIHMDYGYCFLSWIINKLHMPAQSIIISMNIISIGCVAKMIQRYSQMPIMSVLIFLPFFFQFDMHAARTACAMGILTLAIPYIIERKPLKFLAIQGIAALFHPEALIGLALYFLPVLNLGLITSMVILVIDIVLSTFNLTETIMLKILSMIGVQSLYVRFLSYTLESNPMNYGTNIFDPRILMCLVIFMYAKFVRIERDKYTRFLVNASFVTIFMMYFFRAHAIFVYRLSSFYGIYSLLLIPLLVTGDSLPKDSIIRAVYKPAIVIRNLKYLVIALYTFLSVMYAVRISVPYKLFELTYW